LNLWLGDEQEALAVLNKNVVFVPPFVMERCIAEWCWCGSRLDRVDSRALQSFALGR